MSNMLKKLVWVGGLVAALLIAILAAPFLIDFSRFKPQIQTLLSDKLNAKIDFESAKLTIFGGLGVKVKKVTLVNDDAQFKDTKLFSVDNLIFRANFWSLVSDRKFIGTVEIDEPEINLVKNGTKNNIASLFKSEQIAKDKTETPPLKIENGISRQRGVEERVKPSTENASDKLAEEKIENSDKTDSKNLESLKSDLVIEAFHIKNAAFKIKERDISGAEKEVVKVTNLDIDISNIGVERDIKILIATKMMVLKDGLSVKGPLTAEINTKAVFEKNAWKSALFKIKVDASQLAINSDEVFVKKSDVLFDLKLHGTVTPGMIDIPEFTLNLLNLAAKGFVNINDFSELKTRASLSVINHDLSLLSDVLPKHKNVLVNASLEATAGMNGALAKISGIQTRAELKAAFTGSDLKMKWDSEQLTPLKGKLILDSNRIDLPSLLRPFLKMNSAQQSSPIVAEPIKPKVQNPPQNVAGSKAETVDTAPKKQDVTATTPVSQEPENQTEFSLTPEQLNMLAGSVVGAKISVKELVTEKTKISNILLDLLEKDAVITLNKFSFNAFGGSLNLKSLLKLNVSPIQYNSQLTLAEVRAEQILPILYPQASDLLEGAFNLNLNLEGAGTTFKIASQKLSGTGNFKVVNGQLHSAGIVKGMQEDFDKFIGELSIVDAADALFKHTQKIIDEPAVKLGGVAQDLNIDKIKRDYENIRSVGFVNKLTQDHSLKDVSGTLVIKDGRINFETKKNSVDGDVKIEGWVGLDLTLGGKALFTATPLLKEKMLQQSRHAKLLFDDKGGLDLGMVLSGTAKQPGVAVDVSVIKERFIRNARELVENEVRKKAEELILSLLKKKSDAATEELKKKLKDEGKKLEQQAKADPQLEKARQDAKKALEKNKVKLKGLFGK